MGVTCLHYTMITNDVDTFKILLSRNEDMNMVDGVGYFFFDIFVNNEA